MHPCSRLVLVILVGLMPFSATEAYERTVLVGGYPYPPYVVGRGTEPFRGATVDVLEQLNDWQSRIEFQFVPVAAFSRELSFRQGRFEAMFFESPDWGWRDESVSISDPIATDRDLYVALDKDDRDQRFFDDIHKKHLIATRGYHYGFASYRTDEQWLQEQFTIDFAPSLAAGLEMLMRERGEVAVLHESYLRARENQGLDMSQLLVSEREDNAYQLSVLVSTGAGLDMDWILTQLRELREAGQLERIEQRWGIRFTDF